MLRVEMMAAERGDAILIEYGEGSEPGHRVLIDGGPVNSGTYDLVQERLRQIPTSADGRRHFDLLIVSHVDTDHIEGVIRLLQDVDLRCVFDDIWFNGWKHLVEIDEAATVSVLGGLQGEFLGALLQMQGRPWNQLMLGGPVFVPDAGDLPTFTLRGGLVLTLLSPTFEKLEELVPEWQKHVRNVGLEPGDTASVLEQLSDKWWARPPKTLGEIDRIERSNDNGAANGSSIAVLAEFGERAVLLGADAHDDVLTASIRRLRTQRELAEPLPIDALKLSHHGSKNNTTVQLLAELACEAYMVSTSGDRFDHPDAIAIKRLIDQHQGSQKPLVLFNYDQKQSKLWKDKPELDVQFGPGAILDLP